MKNVERRGYQKPATKIVKIQHQPILQATSDKTDNDQSREFRGSFFEEDD